MIFTVIINEEVFRIVADIRRVQLAENAKRIYIKWPKDEVWGNLPQAQIVE